MSVLAGVPKLDTSHMTAADIADWIGPRVGDIVRSGPGQTRFTVTATNGAWFKLQYPHGLGVIWRQADALTLVQAAPAPVVKAIVVVVAPERTIRTQPKFMRVGDVLWRDNQRLTIRFILSRAGSHYLVWATQSDGTWVEVALDVMGTHALCGGPTFDARMTQGTPGLHEIVDAAIEQRGRVA